MSIAAGDRPTSDRAPEADRRPHVAFAVTVTTGTILTLLGAACAIVFVLYVGYLAWPALTWVLVAAFLAMALNPAVEALERQGLGRGVASAVVFAAALAVAAGIGWLVVPPLVGAVTQFLEELPVFLRELDRGQGPLGFLEQQFGLGDRLQRAYAREGIVGVLGLERAGADWALSAVGTALTVVAIPFLTYFMLVDGKRWVNGAISALPLGLQPRAARVSAGIYRTVGGYVTGNLTISLVAGVTAGITLHLADVPFALPLAVIVAILDLVPLVGALLATALVGGFALTQGLVACVVVVAVMVAYQQVENHVLQPLVYGRCVDLSPLAILVAILVGTELAGILGALAAIPIGGALSVVWKELHRWRREAPLSLPEGAVVEVEER